MNTTAKPERAAGSPWRLALSIIASLVILALVLQFIDFVRVVALLRQCDPLLLGAALAIAILAQVFAALRLQAIFSWLGHATPTALLLRIHFASLWLNQVLPTGLGGDILRVVSLRRLTSWSDAARGVLLDRAFGVAFLFACCAVQTPIYFFVIADARLAGLIAAAGCGGVAAIAIGAASVQFWGKRIPQKLEFIAHAMTDLRRLLLGDIRLDLLAASAVFVALSVASFAVLGAALHVTAPLWAYCAFVPLVFIAMQFPLSYGGWGPREAATIVLFAIVGTAKEQSFAMAFLYGLVLTASAAPGIFTMMSSGVLRERIAQ